MNESNWSNDRAPTVLAERTANGRITRIVAAMDGKRPRLATSVFEGDSLISYTPVWLTSEEIDALRQWLDDGESGKKLVA